MSPAQWLSIGNKLKEMITNDYSNIRKLYQGAYSINNTNSFIINTNHSAISFNNTGRRYMINDVSNDRIGDEAYFDTLQHAFNMPQMGEAFYVYCRDLVEKNPTWDERQIPTTDAKKNIIACNVPHLFDWIKTRFLKKKRDINCTFARFYDQYIESLAKSDGKQQNVKPSKPFVSKQLTEARIPPIKTTGNVAYIRISYSKLLKIYTDKNWIHDTDDICDVQYDQWKELVDLNRKATSAYARSMRRLRTHLDQMRIIEERQALETSVDQIFDLF
jgi:hypothetical protein